MFIVARENPNILNLTSLQLGIISSKEFNICSLYNKLISSELHPLNSAKIPFSIPEWYPANMKLEIKINKIIYSHNF